jgi:hypothetical protein
MTYINCATHLCPMPSTLGALATGGYRIPQPNPVRGQQTSKPVAHFDWLTTNTLTPTVTGLILGLLTFPVSGATGGPDC